jgi:hypothetical protein
LRRRAEFRVDGLTERDVRERTRRGSSAPRAGLLIVTLSALAVLYAYGQAGPSVELVPRVDFGDQRLRVAGHTETIRVTNRGPSRLGIDTVALEGFHLDDFVVSESTCAGSLIESGGECLIEVRFAPKGEGPRSAELVITDNARSSPQRVTLSGVGVELPAPAPRPEKPPVPRPEKLPAPLAPPARPAPPAPLPRPAPPAPPAPPVETGPKPDPLPRVEITPGLLDFGRREAGRPGLGQTVRMSNVGTGPLVVRSVRPTGADAPEFRVTRETCTGRAVGPGADCEVVVEFTPRAIGVRSAELLLADNAAGSPHHVDLKGVVEAGQEPAALPRVEITPDPVDFGRWEVGRPGAPRTVRVRNVGAGPLLVGSLRRSAVEASEFDVKSQNCTRGRIAPGEACEAVVEFTPRGRGLRDAELLLFDNAAGSPHHVRLVGVGVEAPRPASAPRVEITPNPVDFGARGGGRSRAGQTVWIVNSGTGPLDVGNVTITGADERDFVVTAQMCTRAPVAPRERCGIELEFRPRAPGLRAAQLLITDNAPGNPHRVALSGSVHEAPPTPGIKIAPGALNFGSALVGRARIPGHLQVTSVGTAALQVTRIALDGVNAEDFRVVDETCSRSPVRQDTSCTISIEFSPRGVGPRSGSLVITDNAPGGPRRVAMAGEGTAPSIPRQGEMPSRAVDTTRVTPRAETVRPVDPARVIPRVETVRPLDTLRLDSKGWCCAGGNVFSDSSRTCILKKGTFYPTQGAAQRQCTPVIR